MEKRKIIGNYIYYTLYKVLALIAPLITTPYVSRVLGATGIGTYAYTESIAAYFVLIGAVGTDLYGQREIAYVQDDRVRRTKVFWQIVIFRFITVVTASTIFLSIFGFGRRYNYIFRILTLEVIAAAFDVTWFFMGMERFKLVVIRNMVIKIVGIVAIFLLVKSQSDIVLYTICLTLPILIGNLSLWFSLYKYVDGIPKAVFSGFKEMIPSIFILFIPQVATEVYLVLDKTMIGMLSTGIDQVGFYTQAQKVINIILMLVISMGTVMMPAMSSAFAKGRQKEIVRGIRITFRFTYMLSFALVFGISAVGPIFVPLFFGQGYNAVTPLMIIMSPILVIIGTSNVIGKQYLLPTKQQREYTLSVICGAIVNFIANLILIPLLDAVGAAIATVLAELSVAIVQCYSVREQLPLITLFKCLPRYLIYGAIMYSIIRMTVRFINCSNLLSLMIMIIFGIIIYAIEVLITRDELAMYVLESIAKMRKGYS